MDKPTDREFVMEQKSRRERKREKLVQRFKELKEKERLLLEYIDYVEKSELSLPPIVKSTELD